jgi:hypothetical protein
MSRDNNNKLAAEKKPSDSSRDFIDLTDGDLEKVDATEISGAYGGWRGRGYHYRGRYYGYYRRYYGYGYGYRYGWGCGCGC